MDLRQMLQAVRDEDVRFVTMRPPGSRFSSLERRVLVTGPSQLVELTRTPDLSVLDELVELLREPGRRWAAAVLLAALTRREEKIVDSFAHAPSEWSESLGMQAYERWSRWLKTARKTLCWDPEQEAFVEAFDRRV
jgi:hypothetical protein